MAFTLGFHIVLASVGVAFPAIMLIANYRGLRHGDEAALLLARRWSKVVAVAFAGGGGAGGRLSVGVGLLLAPVAGRVGPGFWGLFAGGGGFFFPPGVFVARYIFG